MTKLPKGFLAVDGSYLVKAKPVHRVHMAPDEVKEHVAVLKAEWEKSQSEEVRGELAKLKVSV